MASLISSGGGTGAPTVSVTKPKRSYQARIAFNALLARAVGLADFTHLAIDHDAETRTLTFFPCKTKEFRDGLAYALIPDGGGKQVDARAVYLRQSAVEFLPTGRTTLTTPLRRGRPFSITY